MNYLSKFSKYPCGCHEVAHTWSPSCYDSWLDIGIPGITEAAKIYLPLFVLSRLIRTRKIDLRALLKILKETLQSSAFLGANCYFFLSCFCIIRWAIPFLPVREAILLASFTSSYMAIQIERENRRDLLAVYMLNVASETLFKILKARDIVPNIPYGLQLLEAFSLAAILYLYKLGKCEGLMGQIAKALLGTAEIFPQSPNVKSEVSAGAKLINYITGLITGKRATSADPGAAAGPICPHVGSCARYVCAGFSESLVLGVTVQAALTLGGSLIRLATTGRLPARPPPPAALLRLGLSLGGTTGLFRLVSCALRRLRGRDAAWHALPAGAAAAAGFHLYAGRSLALYLFWKTVEAWHAEGAGAGRLPRPPGGAALLYALSTGVVLSAAVLEPHQIRRSYWNFLCRLTGGRVAEMNWHLIGRHCGARTLVRDDLRQYQPVFHPAEVRLASLPLLRELGQLKEG